MDELLTDFNAQIQQADPEAKVTYQGVSLFLDDHELIHGPQGVLETFLSECLIPEVTQLHLAFPTLESLPCPAPPLESLPGEFQRGEHVACQAADRLWQFGNLNGFQLRCRLPMTQQQGDHVLNLVCAHLNCFGYQHEHKIAWAGMLLDRWFKVSRITGA